MLREFKGNKRLYRALPRIGIRPTIDGRLWGVRAPIKMIKTTILKNPSRLIFFITICLIMSLSVNTNIAALSKTAPGDFVSRLKKAHVKVIDVDGKTVDSSIVKIERKWIGNLCNSKIINISNNPIKLGNIILFDLPEHRLDPKTPIYGEGFQMLSQTAGTLKSPIDLSVYTDRNHYRIPEPDSIRTVYNLMTFDLGKPGFTLLGFATCKRFAGRFSFTDKALRVSIDPEGLELAPGETWQLEKFIALNGTDCNVLLDTFAQYIEINQPPLKLSKIPTGWCSWYSYGDKATKAIVLENLAVFSEIMPELKYIQIDEGYSPYEGDWLDYNPAFGDMQSTLDSIRAKGFLPGIWVAPFIAEKNSRVLREHPEWFVKGDDGKPLDSSMKGFGGWRHGPWFVLDGTNPEVQHYHEKTFRTMREKWGITYFKLDANYWGAIHGGKYFNPKATRIEAYRLGMEALVKGAGSDAVILGCNAPMWPSIGLVTSMRTSNDIYRSWNYFQKTAKENLYRNWQNGRLWINDPDCILLTGNESIPQNVWLLHATVIHSIGGMIISGDKAVDLKNNNLSILKKSIPPTGQGAKFTDTNFEIGTTNLGDKQYYYFFNWGDKPVDRIIHLKKKSKLIDYWSGENLGVYMGNYTIKALAGQSARLILAISEK